MSLNFSRRTFFRFLATAVMTVACVGMLAGCGSDSSKPTRKGDGKITNLNVTVDVDRNPDNVTDGDNIFHFNIDVGRDNNVDVTYTNFWIAVDHDDTVTYYNYTDGAFTFSNFESSEDVVIKSLPVKLAKNEELDLDLTIDTSVVAISEGDEIDIYYQPDVQYPGYYSGWIYTW